ncbi:MAG: rhomboid family intramembrane serine protease [Anaerolineae bacterium]|nr:rhomboid family intramembrane serine protease [Anaerolineae bacterium]
MIPIKTTNARTDHVPYLTYGLIIANILVFLWETTLPPAALRSSLYNLAIVPCELGNNLISGETALDFLRSMFLHGDWLHLGGNMLFLWIFGSNIEDYYGWRIFALFYVVGGVVAALVQALVVSNLCIPVIGASGAISAILGSYILLYPGIKVRVGVVFFRFFFQTFLLPVWLVLGYWFAMQLINGWFSLGIETLGEGGVAFMAHVAGFIFGAVFAFGITLFKGLPPKTYA